MKIRVPERFTVLVDMDGEDNYAVMINPDLLLIAHDMGLNVKVGQRLSIDPYAYDDVWIDGPDEEVALFKLKYL